MGVVIANFSKINALLKALYVRLKGIPVGARRACPLGSESLVNKGLYYYRLFFVIPSQVGIQYFLKKFSISSTGYPDLDPITESILVYVLLFHCQ